VFCLIFENDLKSLLEKVLEKEKKRKKEKTYLVAFGQPSFPGFPLAQGRPAQ
jgi:hypothetical protein